jgi:hypothetical protein
MGRNNADFEQGAVHLYRGLDRSIGTTDFENLGIHWTPNREIAEQFATMGDREEGDEGGVVLHASVSPQHIVQRGTPEHEEYTSKYDIYAEDDPEEETTVRKGAPITVHGYSDIYPHEFGGNEEEHVSWNEPRSGKA